MGDLPEGAFGGLWYGLDYQTDGTFVNGISKPGYWKTCENAQVTDAHADANPAVGAATEPSYLA